jgi:hypothetical protein
MALLATRFLAHSLLAIAEVGFEPTRPNGQGILSPQRLPFRHSAAFWAKVTNKTQIFPQIMPWPATGAFIISTGSIARSPKQSHGEMVKDATLDLLLYARNADIQVKTQPGRRC